MTTHPTPSLNTDWRYLPQSAVDAGDIDWTRAEEIGQAVADICDASIASLLAGQESGWLVKRIWLSRVDFCVGYTLQFDPPACPVELYVNGKFMAACPATGCTIDITNAVSLDDNIIALKLAPQEGNQQQSFGNIQLLMIPC